jgi:hypothetical protein
MGRIYSLFNSVVLALLLCLCVLLLARESLAEDSEPESTDGKVEIIYPAQSTLPYRDRRGAWSGIFAINVEQIFPGKFRSKISNDSYETLFGETPVPVAQVEAGAQANFGIGSLGASLVYGYGGVKDARSGSDRVLNLTKQGLTLNLTLNTLFSEPYVAPYLQTQFTMFGWEESSFGQPDKSGTTALSTAITVGLLFQLNELDPDSTLQARNNSGINNTFLDVYLSQYNTSESESDPNFESSMNLGAGLRLEF